MDIVQASRQNLYVLLRLSILVLVSTIPGLVTAQVESALRGQKQRLADLHVRPLIEGWLEQSGSPGGVAALVDGDQILVLDGFGLADTGSGRPIDPNTTLFQVAELVRPMTVTAALRLAEQGLMSLDADLSGRDRLQFLELGSYGPLTLEQLFLHTSGFDHRVIASRTDSVDKIQPLATYLRRRMPPRIRPGGEVSTPSIHGYSLAGLLVELATGEAFSDSMDSLVFAPFAMSSSTVDPEDSRAADLATGYLRQGEIYNRVAVDYPQTTPASFLLTTASDMARWLQIVLSDGSLDGQALLDSESIARLLSSQFTHHPALPGRSLAFREGSQFSPPELYLAARGGGFSSVLLLLPHRRVGLFAAFNSEIELWSLVYPILDTFEAQRPRRRAVDSAPAISNADQLTGYWQDAAVSKMTAERLLSLIRQGHLDGLYDGSIRWRSQKYEPVGPGEFQQQNSGARICLVESSPPGRVAASEGFVIEKLAWYASTPVQASLWILFATTFLIAGWPRPPLPHRESSLTPSDTYSPRWPMTAARLAATIHFVFIVSLAIILAGALRWQTPDLLYATPPAVLAVLLLPMLGAALTVVAIVGIGFAWRSLYWTRQRLLGLILLSGTLTLFLPFLEYWNLLGFHI